MPDATADFGAKLALVLKLLSEGDLEACVPGTGSRGRRLPAPHHRVALPAGA
jgi:hypothetical protein